MDSLWVLFKKKLNAFVLYLKNISLIIYKTLTTEFIPIIWILVIYFIIEPFLANYLIDVIDNFNHLLLHNWSPFFALGLLVLITISLWKFEFHISVRTDIIILLLYIKFRVFYSELYPIPIFKGLNFPLYLDFVPWFLFFKLVFYKIKKNYDIFKQIDKEAIKKSEQEALTITEKDKSIIYYLFKSLFYEPDIQLLKYSSDKFIFDLTLSEEIQYKQGFKIDDPSIDTLNRRKFAEQLASTITNMRPQKSFVIGINGAWGSGKSSLVQLIKNQIKKSDKEFLILDFNPWYFNSADELLKKFFNQFEKIFPYQKRLSQQLGIYVKLLSKTEKTLFKTDFLDMIFNENESIEAVKNNIKEEIYKINKTILITIDDLDRIDKYEIIYILKLIRLIADFPNTIYILSYDRAYLENAIKGLLSEHAPEKHLDKIINIEFNIPELQPENIRESFKRRLNQIRDLNPSLDLTKEQIDECLSFADLLIFVQNERETIKFANNLSFKYASISQEVNFYYLFLLELVSYKFYNIYKEIYIKGIDYIKPGNNGNNFDSALLEYKTNNRDEFDALNNILFILFDKNKKDSLYFIRNFYQYFSLSLLPTQITKTEFQKSLNKNENEISVDFIGYYERNTEEFFHHFYNALNNQQRNLKDKLFKAIDTLEIMYRFKENIYLSSDTLEESIKHSRDNDTYFDEELDLDKYLYRIRFRSLNNFWRLGLKFENKDGILEKSVSKPDRHSKNTYIHFGYRDLNQETKKPYENNFHFHLTEYQQQEASGYNSDIFIETPTIENATIQAKIFKNNTDRICVKTIFENFAENYEFSFESTSIHSSKCLLSAWADWNSYTIEIIEIERIPIGSTKLNL